MTVRPAPVLAVLAVLVPPAAAADAPPPAAPPAARLTYAQAEALVREVSARVESIRGLKFKTPVALRIVSGAEARAQFTSEITPEVREQARHTQDALVQMGLVPPGTDLVGGYLDLAETGLAGYYPHGSGTFYLLDHVSAREARPVMAHELTHALEDQHYGLAAFSGLAAGNPDRAAAITAVVEGSATAVMLAYLGREQAAETEPQAETRRAARLSVAPSFTQRTLLLPYLLGVSFLFRGRSWESANGALLARDIDEAYRYPPRSTRQILHPEQYWGGGRYKEQALALPDLSATLGPGWSKAAEGSIGELGLAVLTGSRQSIELPWALLPARWTNDAAAGSVGDVYQHYVRGDRRVTILLTRWETEADADQFARALLSKGKYFIRYGVNFLLIAGDVGDRAEKLGIAALQGTQYWQ